VVNDIGHIVDQLDGFFRHIVTGSRLAANQYTTVGPVGGIALLDPVIKVYGMQDIQQLPLVFVDALDLDVK
jgi:hypothetical protein